MVVESLFFTDFETEALFGLTLFFGAAFLFGAALAVDEELIFTDSFTDAFAAGALLLAGLIATDFFEVADFLATVRPISLGLVFYRRCARGCACVNFVYRALAFHWLF